ncbi:Ger(x)C family spore germination C-terminal domain-containing protein [Paenibacillus sp. D2_2]|uniref:Ger(x)C family spore germination C-terminal domain-containing protein n=1 Tax=Paenibacillus sp. D2_2 TaxID=3073092 RepID=UPI002815F136|nr:Ger(x)C family spore germination C-terminal domain-containing protein [Paenibacillus sp. D2_2]WMT43378.1 Ger(x)C family spore germination C-terminal domain-containing protein [Paenibacillus sp. D2_2]
MRDNIKSTLEHTKCPDGGNVSLEIIHSKTKSRGKVVQGKPQIDINVQINGNISEVECRDLNLLDIKTIKMLEQLFNDRIKSIMEASIHTVQQKFGADIFGFGEIIHRSNPRAWKELRHDWDERYFRTLPVNIRVSVNIQRLGTTKDSFLKDMKE